MPKKKDMNSLLRLCLNSIAANMKELWAKDYVQNYVEEYNFLYIMGPFDHLTGSLVQELLKILVDANQMTRAYLHLLLVPHLSELSLGGCATIVSNPICQLISTRCKNLTFLDLHNCKRIHPSCLVDMVEILPGLRKVNFSGTQCNTPVLVALGLNCTALRDLDISDCRMVTSVGLLYLAYDPLRGVTTGSRLQRLVATDIDSKESTYSVEAIVFLLLSLTQLEYLEHNCLVDACYSIATLNFGTQDCFAKKEGFPSLSELVQLRMNDSKRTISLNLRRMLEVEIGLLDSLVPLSEKVVEASIKCGSTLKSGWEQLLWPNLNQLTLQHCGTHFLALEELLPVLENLGPNLRYLSIQDFCFIHGSTIGHILTLCSNLAVFHCHLECIETNRVLDVGDEEDDDLSVLAMKHHLPRMKEFILRFPDNCSSLPAETRVAIKMALVSLLKGSSKLEKLLLLRLPFSLDKIFFKVFKETSFALRSLHTMSLAHSGVSVDTAFQLLNEDNQLSHLDLSYCQDISRKDYEQLKRMINKKKFDMHITWK
ncbi:uncharacterized protein si:ch211-214j8.12 [Erpetoichthys calabaricus]|uniref:Uncharacterized LOC114654227 n=1 Tax=Erpetoichthys calabaricus TaxID=27687 RepID=A0A8C4SE71_ERPCA|nr:uncharacterized protein si:ch211-214j8.12 [Erpetoichthys calabaricus]